MKNVIFHFFKKIFFHFIKIRIFYKKYNVFCACSGCTVLSDYVRKNPRDIKLMFYVFTVILNIVQNNPMDIKYKVFYVYSLLVYNVKNNKMT